MFHDAPARPNYAELEHDVLRLWEREHAFEQLRAQTAGGPKWSFLDGPITANNPMGAHHGWGRTYKDVYNRFHAMLGHELRWQQGFDCQGLWVEVEVEKELGFTSKRQIEQYGVAAFVERCKERVHRFAAVQTEQSRRLGYWMDWDNSYYTLSDENNYAVWGFLKRCAERGWLQRGHDVMPWCPRCGTALSEHEIAGEGYAEKTHLSLTVAFPLLDRPGEALLAWTTTPWTLPANVAAAVHPELMYVRVEGTGDKETRRQGDKGADTTSYWLAKDALERLNTQSSALSPEHFTVLEERLGAELVGWRYSGPFDHLEVQTGLEHRVVAWDEVSQGEGTGVVHVAPGAGREDHALGRREGLAVLAPLDEHGVYLAGYGALSGRRAAEVAEDVAADLAGQGLLFERAPYTHRYPVCWRCGTELLFRLVDEWFVSMGELRHAMMDSAHEARWVPAFGLERELDWLRNMGDWMISKKRYWGLALPFYPCAACGHVTVVGSRQELEARAAAGWEEFQGHSPHRPWVDGVLVRCERCGAPTERVPDVGNVWLDAGVVPFATLHYYDDRASWAEWFPADLVLESFPGQFRNWFYSLLAVSTVLEGRAPFKTLLGYATVKDERGDDMHKSKGNSVPFEQAADWLGVEPMRWMFASAALERNLLFGRGLVEEHARRLQPLWEVYRFFVMYANLEASSLGLDTCLLWREPPALGPQAASLDRWLLLRLDELVAAGRERLGSYDARGFTQEVERFLDDLSNWYVRRSRRRFWGAEDVSADDRRAAFRTLYYTLVTLARLLAPVLPFLSEALYQNLVRSVDASAPASVHLTGYPGGGARTEDEGRRTQDQRPATEDERRRAEDRGRKTEGRDGEGFSETQSSNLTADMAVVRRAAALGRVARKQAGLRVRQPLARMLVVVDSDAERAALRRLQSELLDELNVKALELMESTAELLRYRLSPNLPLLGPRLGRRLAALRLALATLAPDDAAKLARGSAVGQTVSLTLDDGEVALAPGELLVETSPLEGFAVAQEAGLQVALDTALTEPLRREGQARDLVRLVQDARKAAGMSPADRVAVYLDGGEALGPMLEEWGAFVQRETLATTLALAAPPRGAYSQQVRLDGEGMALGLARADSEH